MTFSPITMSIRFLYMNGVIIKTELPYFVHHLCIRNFFHNNNNNEHSHTHTPTYTHTHTTNGKFVMLCRV